MSIRLEQKEEFHICGIGVKTYIANNSTDMSSVSENLKVISLIESCEEGFYGLEWYTDDNAAFYYMLGKAVDKDYLPKENMMLKCLKKSTYLVKEIAANADMYREWTDFFYSDILNYGYKIDKDHGFYFEYYPYGLKTDCELWVPVLRK